MTEGRNRRKTEVELAEERDDTAGATRAWLGWAACVGYAACGAVYIVIGLIAAAVTVGAAERPGGAQRAMGLLARQPLGEVLVVALGIGFLGYAALNLSGALRDPEGRGAAPLSGSSDTGFTAREGALPAGADPVDGLVSLHRRSAIQPADITESRLRLASLARAHAILSHL